MPRLRQSQTIILIGTLLLLGGATIYLAATAGSGTDTNRTEREPETVLEASALQDLLASRDGAATIESIEIEPREDRDARFVVTFRNSQKNRVAYAEFPGTITKQLYAARIPYSVKSKDDSYSSLTKEKELDATTFRALLGDPEEAAAIETIRIEQGGRNHAKYVMKRKTDSIVRVVYAEFPGDIVKQIEAAGIAYSVRDVR